MKLCTFPCSANWRCDGIILQIFSKVSCIGMVYRKLMSDLTFDECVSILQRELALRWNHAAGDDGEADEHQERIPEVRVSDSFVCVA